MSRKHLGCNLEQCIFCTGVTPEWRPLLGLNRETIRIKRGKRLFSEGEPVRDIYFLEKGTVKVHQRWTDDKELILRFAGAGAIVGHRGLGQEMHYPVSATALEDCSVCVVPVAFFFATLKMNPDLLFRMMLFFAEELRESEERMRNMARLPVKSRVAGVLLTMGEKFGLTQTGFLNLALSRQDLAAYVGATYETVFRMLQELEEAGYIRAEGKQLAVKDALALEKLYTFANVGIGGVQ